MRDFTTDRRTLLAGAAATAASAILAPARALAADGLDPVRKALAANHDAAVKRLQDWIRFPSIAAENRSMPEGAAYMAKLATDAGFQQAEIVPTRGHPGVFATLDAGAKRTMGIYFMYDVKQFDPFEWSSPPLDAALVDKPGFGQVVVV